jgi:hypothetical protein
VDFRPDLTVVTGDLMPTSQAEVDALVGVTEVTGSLFIYPEAYEITNLDGLSSLSAVGGDLRILNLHYYCVEVGSKGV